jgi:flagellar protein FlaG
MAIQSITSSAAGLRPDTPQQPAPARSEPGSTAAPSARPAQPQQPDTRQLGTAVERINEQLRAAAQNIRFSIDEDTGKTIVRVVDSNSGELIRQIPSEEVLAVSRSLERLQGLLLHQRV